MAFIEAWSCGRSRGALRKGIAGQALEWTRPLRAFGGVAKVEDSVLFTVA